MEAYLMIKSNVQLRMDRVQNDQMTRTTAIYSSDLNKRQRPFLQLSNSSMASKGAMLNNEALARQDGARYPNGRKASVDEYARESDLGDLLRIGRNVTPIGSLPQKGRYYQKK